LCKGLGASASALAPFGQLLSVPFSMLVVSHESGFLTARFIQQNDRQIVCRASQCGICRQSTSSMLLL
jgi:hypothetical protein